MYSTATQLHKQAERSFFPSSTMPAPYTSRSSVAPTLGGAPATPEQIRSQNAWNEGFKEGLVGALKGDGARGLVRGGLRETADIVDWMGEAPYKAPFIPAMLLAKAIKWSTGNADYENSVRAVRNKAVNTLAYGTHKATEGLRWWSDRKALDPKYLTDDAYNQSVLAGRGAVIAADLVIGSKIDKALKLGSWLKYFRDPSKAGNISKALRMAKAVRTLEKAYNGMLVAEGLSEAGGAIATGVEEGVATAMEEANKQQAAQPTVSINRTSTAPYLAAMLGATAGIGTYGATALIPKLKNKKALRLILAGLATIPGAYAGYKVVQPTNK